MPDGIPFGKATWRYVAEPEVFMRGVMNGCLRMGLRKRWRSVLGYPRVCRILNVFFFPWPRLIATLTEKFETRDLKWAPDGKGLILMDKDVFCCAFEVEEEEPPAEA